MKSANLIAFVFGLKLSCCALTLAQSVSLQETGNPNVLFIAMDDLNDWIGCLGGHSQTITPNLDRLAASGVLFTNAHCPAPACNPSRSALEATQKYLDRFPADMPIRRRYALAMLAAIDDGVGRVVEKLTEHGLLDNTLIVMTSDNGAPLKMTKPDAPIDGDMGGWDGSLNEPWVGEKGMLSEGGIRVPMIWSFPSQLPSGKTYNWPVSTLDIAPSVLQMAGGKLQEVRDQFDGIDMIPAMNDIQHPSTRTLYFRFWDQAAIRRGKWKYIFVGDRQRYLFDLESDQHEHKNLVNEHSELANKLHEDLKSWCADLKPGVAISTRGNSDPPYDARDFGGHSGWNLIANFGRAKFGEPLFRPNPRPEGSSPR